MLSPPTSSTTPNKREVRSSLSLNNNHMKFFLKIIIKKKQHHGEKYFSFLSFKTSPPLGCTRATSSMGIPYGSCRGYSVGDIQWVYGRSTDHYVDGVDWKTCTAPSKDSNWREFRSCTIGISTKTSVHVY